MLQCLSQTSFNRKSQLPKSVASDWGKETNENKWGKKKKQQASKQKTNTKPWHCNTNANSLALSQQTLALLLLSHFPGQLFQLRKINIVLPFSLQAPNPEASTPYCIEIEVWTQTAAPLGKCMPIASKKILQGNVPEDGQLLPQSAIALAKAREMQWEQPCDFM